MAFDFGSAAKGSIFGLGGMLAGGTGALSDWDPTVVKKTTVAPTNTANSQAFLTAAQQQGKQVAAPQLGASPQAQAAEISRQGMYGSQGQQQQLVNRLLSAEGAQQEQQQALQTNRALAEQGARAQMAALASGRGNAASANRQAMQQGALMQQQAAQQGMQQAGQSELQRQQLASQILGQQYGTEAGLAQSQAQLAQQAALANQQLQGQYGLTGAQQALQAQQANQAAELQRLGLQGQAQMGMDNMSNQNLALQAKLDADRANQQREAKGGLLSGIGSALGTVLPMISDKRAKKDIKATTSTASRELDKMAGSGSENRKFLDALQAYEYTYKHEGRDATTQMGIMAQDLEKTRLGKQMVVQDAVSGLKTVDFGRGFGAMLASQAELNKRIKKLEGAKGRVA